MWIDWRQVLRPIHRSTGHFLDAGGSGKLMLDGSLSCIEGAQPARMARFFQPEEPRIRMRELTTFPKRMAGLKLAPA